MKILKTFFSLSLILIITIASTIPAYASPSYIDSEKINVGNYTFTQHIDAGNHLKYQILGDNDTFDKAELAVRIWYRDGNRPAREHKFEGQTFYNSSSCIYDDKDYYSQMMSCFHIDRVKAWCRITKNGVSEENIINLYLDY